MRLPYSPVPDVAAQGAPSGVYSGVSADPSEFGGQIGAALQGGSQKIDAGTDAIQKVASTLQSMTNETNATQNWVKMSKDISDIKNSFSQLQGTDAQAALPATQQKIADIYNQYAANSQSEMERKMFEGMATRNIVMVNEQLGSHAAYQTVEAHKKGMLAGMSQIADDAAADGPQAITYHKDRLDDAARQYAIAQGVAPEEQAAYANGIVRQLLSPVAHAQVMQALDHGGTKAAESVARGLRGMALQDGSSALSPGALASADREINQYKMMDEMKVGVENNNRMMAASMAYNSGQYDKYLAMPGPVPTKSNGAQVVQFAASRDAVQAALFDQSGDHASAQALRDKHPITGDTMGMISGQTFVDTYNHIQGVFQNTTGRNAADGVALLYPEMNIIPHRSNGAPDTFGLVGKQLATQAAMGIPSEQRSALTTPQAQQLWQQAQQSGNPLQFLSQLYQNAGPNAGAVRKSMQNIGVPAGMNFAIDNFDPDAQQKYLQVTTISKDGKKPTYDLMKESMDGGTQKSIQKMIENDPTFSARQASLAYQGQQGLATGQAEYKALDALVTANIASNMPWAEATRDALKQFSSKYEVLSPKTIVPSGYGNMVRQYAPDLIGGLKVSDLDMSRYLPAPTTTNEQAVYNNRAAAYLQQAEFRNVKDNPNLLAVYVNGDPLRDKRGRGVTFSMNDFNAAARVAKPQDANASYSD